MRKPTKSPREMIRILLDGLRGQERIAELYHCEGISQGIYYKWSKDFMEAGEKRLAGDTACAANVEEVKELSREAEEVGHTVRLIPPIYVKPFVKRHKNNAVDAEAIVEAALRPSMGFVGVKTKEQ